jgi:hypothetical protein
VNANFAALQAANNDTFAKLGDVTTLKTTAKTDAVSALNEVLGDVGNLSNLTTTAKSDLVSAVNEVKASIATVGGAVTLQSAGPVAQTGNLGITGTGAFGSVTGNGSGLTSLNATNLASGTVADARLTANIPLLNATTNAFTQNATFGGNVTVSGTLTATVAGVVNLQAAGPVAQTGNLGITGTGAFGSVTGNGSGLTTLNATNLSSGTVNDARLSANVPLLNAGSNTFTGTLSASKFTSPVLDPLPTASAPAATTAGQVYYDTNLKALMVTDGTNFRPVGPLRRSITSAAGTSFNVAAFTPIATAATFTKLAGTDLKITVTGTVAFTPNVAGDQAVLRINVNSGATLTAAVVLSGDNAGVTSVHPVSFTFVLTGLSGSMSIALEAKVTSTSDGLVIGPTAASTIVPDDTSFDMIIEEQ